MKPEAAVALAGFEWQLKQRAALAVEHFNKDYKKGFQFLQVRALGARSDVKRSLGCCRQNLLVSGMGDSLGWLWGSNCEQYCLGFDAAYP
jgi:hypothetical protein